MRALSIVMFLASVVAKKGDAPPAAPSMVESAVQAITAMVSDALGASMDLAKDAGGLALAGPRFGVDLYLWGVAHVRSFPSLIVKVYNGDEATLTGFTDFCVVSPTPLRAHNEPLHVAH